MAGAEVYLNAKFHLDLSNRFAPQYTNVTDKTNRTGQTTVRWRRANRFWATACKTVRSMLSDGCLSCLSVCDVGVLWPKGWMDQYETRHGGRPRPWPHCVRWGPTPSQKGHGLQFSADVCCGQTAGWLEMPLGREVCLGPGHIVLDGDPAPPPH